MHGRTKAGGFQHPNAASRGAGRPVGVVDHRDPRAPQPANPRNCSGDGGDPGGAVCPLGEGILAVPVTACEPEFVAPVEDHGLVHVEHHRGRFSGAGCGRHPSSHARQAERDRPGGLSCRGGDGKVGQVAPRLDRGCRGLARAIGPAHRIGSRIFEGQQAGLVRCGGSGGLGSRGRGHHRGLGGAARKDARGGSESEMAQGHGVLPAVGGARVNGLARNQPRPIIESSIAAASGRLR